MSRARKSRPISRRHGDQRRRRPAFCAWSKRGPASSVVWWTQWEHAYFDTLQNQLLKVGARVEELRTKVKFHFPSFPLKQVYGYMLARLQAAWP